MAARPFLIDFQDLEAIPSKANLRKSVKITAREVSLARGWHREGLLSAGGIESG